MARTPTELVRDFCAAWSALDADAIMKYFTPDAVYHNMPGPPVQGHDAIKSTIERFLGGWTRTTWDVLNIAAEGNIVFAERVDRTDAGSRHVDLPVVGVFEVDGDRIRAWRDYFDLATYTRALTA